MGAGDHKHLRAGTQVRVELKVLGEIQGVSRDNLPCLHPRKARVAIIYHQYTLLRIFYVVGVLEADPACLGRISKRASWTTDFNTLLASHTP